MDLFFGLDKPAIKEEGLSLLATVYDDILLQMYEALLKEDGIPYIKKDRGSGGAMRILMGNNTLGTDIFVPDEALDRAKLLVTYEPSDTADEAAADEGEQK